MISKLLKILSVMLQTSYSLERIYEKEGDLYSTTYIISEEGSVIFTFVMVGDDLESLLDQADTLAFESFLVRVVDTEKGKSKELSEDLLSSVTLN